MSNNTSHAHLLQISRAILHGVHAIFPPPAVTGHTGFDPVALSKLDTGESTWEHFKDILGWIMDGLNGTTQLPVKKRKDICVLIQKLLKNRRVMLNKFQKLADKSQHASMGIPGERILFTPINMSISGNPDFILITPTLRQCLEDWSCLIQCTAKTPTSVLQLIVAAPTYISYTNACRLGAGVVWCSGTKCLNPFMWQVEWPQDIQDNLATAEKPNGKITINDLELAGALLGFLALEEKRPTTHIYSPCHVMKQHNNGGMGIQIKHDQIPNFWVPIEFPGTPNPSS